MLNYQSGFTFIYSRTKLRGVGGNFLVFYKIYDSDLGYIKTSSVPPFTDHLGFFCSDLTDLNYEGSEEEL